MFAALIHDVDHPGISNQQLIEEQDNEMAIMYNNQSIAEQNSIDYAWGLLMDDSYDEFRTCIFGNDNENSELQRFRKLLVNCVLATDIFDSKLQSLRNTRWEKAFSSHADNNTTTNNSEDDDEDDKDMTDLKATIVIEHMMQVRTFVTC